MHCVCNQWILNRIYPRMGDLFEVILCEEENEKRKEMKREEMKSRHMLLPVAKDLPLVFLAKIGECMTHV